MNHYVSRPRVIPLRTVATLAILALLAAPAPAQTQPLQTPPAISFDRALEEAAQLPRLHSLLIGWKGELLVEQYFNNTRPAGLANLKSASKSVMSAMVGIALDRGIIETVRQPIGAFFPDLLAGEDNASKRAITIEDLLTMRSGLETTSNRNYGAWVQSSNWVRFALNQPLIRTPGTRMDYSTGNTHLLSAILTRLTGTSTWRFARDFLAEPLGFSLAQWPRDPQGIFFGGNDMTMTPKQMMAFGEMYLNGGRANGRQVIPEQWVKASFVARTPSPRERGRFYGYGWWIRQMAGHATFYAWGYGGQFVFLVPDLDLVVVTTSSSNPGEGRGRHLREIYRIVEDHIVSPITPSDADMAAVRAGEGVGLHSAAETALR